MYLFQVGVLCLDYREQNLRRQVGAGLNIVNGFALLLEWVMLSLWK